MIIGRLHKLDFKILQSWQDWVCFLIGVIEIKWITKDSLALSNKSHLQLK